MDFHRIRRPSCNPCIQVLLPGRREPRKPHKVKLQLDDKPGSAPVKPLNTRKLSGGLRGTPYRNHSIRMPITVVMSRSIVSAIVTGLLTLTGLASGADVRGIITIQRKLTPRNVP